MGKIWVKSIFGLCRCLVHIYRQWLLRITLQKEPTTNKLPGINIHHNTKKPPASPIKLEQIRQKTERAPTLSLLKEVIFNGWPKKRSYCPTPLQEFWNFREEITIQDSILLKLNRIIIPTSLRSDILNNTQQSHLGQESGFWELIQLCYDLVARMSSNWLTCANLARSTNDKTKHNQSCKQTHHHNPWQRLSSDLFHCKGSQYLLVSDQFSKFPVIHRLTSITSATTIH